MALLHDHSSECTKSELDLFTVPPTQTSVEKGQWVEYHPISSITDGGPIEFFVPGSGDEYTDPSQTQLYVKAQIVRGDGSAIADDSPVGPTNLLLHSIFNQVDVTLNERLISSSIPTYPYRAMIETLLSYNGEAKRSQLTASMFVNDTAGHMDHVDFLVPKDVNATDDDVDEAPNLGLETRRDRTKGSRVVDMIGPVHGDLFFQDRLLLNGVDLKLKFIRSSDAFCLMAPGDNPSYRLKVMNASLFIRKVKISPAVMLGHVKALERGTAKYPLRRVICKMVSVPSGNMSMTQDHVFLGQLPHRIVIGCVSNEAFNGRFSKNPFNFRHFNANFLTVHLDGDQIPYSPLKPNFDPTHGNYVRAYHTLFSGTDKMY